VISGASDETAKEVKFWSLGFIIEKSLETLANKYPKQPQDHH
jgi:hypothetical protein